MGRLSELNSGARAILANPAHAPFALSAISVWEVCTKCRKRPHELALQLPIEQWLAVALPKTLIRVIPIDAEIARLSNQLPGTFHEDPADRLIVASAIAHKLTLVTSDERILAYPHIPCFDTR